MEGHAPAVDMICGAAAAGGEAAQREIGGGREAAVEGEKLTC
jgi:hypothetical protein